MRERRFQRWLAGVLGALLLSLLSLRAEEGSATRSGPAHFSPGETLSLRLLLAPLTDTALHAVTETLPPGLEFVSADNGGLYSPATRELRWGVYFDGRVRTLNYRVRVLPDATAALAWHGVATFDAAEIRVAGLPESLRRGAASGTVRRTLPADFRTGQPFTVRLGVTSDATVGFHAVDEGTPAGWTVSELNFGGVVGADGRLKWGPFPDGDARELSYVLTPPAGATVGQFAGRGLFGEIEVAISGPDVLAVRPSGGGRIQRQLPTGYRVGRPVEVTLRVEPDAAVSLFAVLETVPAGWTVVEAPGAAAVDLGAGRIRWGPFVEPTVRELTYRVVPAAAAAETVRFAGSADFDAVTVATTGTGELPPLVLTPTVAIRQLPASFRAGQRITVQVTVTPGEGVDAYGVQESLPPGWTVESAVGAGVEGSLLTWGPFFDGSPRSFTYEVRAPLGAGVAAVFAGRVSAAGGPVVIGGPDTSEPAPPPGGRVTRTLPLDFVPGNLFSVTNRVVPDAGVAFNVVAESVPAGWTVVQALPEGALDATAGQYKWGPFTDDAPRLLVLTLRSPMDAAAIVSFAGRGTFAGVEKATEGTAAVPRNLPPALSAVGDQFVLEDEPLALRLVARDDLLLGPQLDLSLEAEPAELFPAAGFGQIIEGNTRIIVLTPAFEASGLATVRLALSDGTHVTRRQFRVAVTARNDAPRFDLPVVTEPVPEDGAPVVLSGLQIHDDDAGEAPLTLALNVVGGALLLGELGPVQRLDDGSAPGHLRLRGSQAELNTVLPQLRLQPAPDFFGDLLLTLEAADGGERGPGGVQTGRADWVLPVMPVNDAPVNVASPVAELTVLEDAQAADTRYPGWLTGLRVGPDNEAVAGQTLISEVSVTAPALFRQLPRLAEDGTLSFQLAPDANGQADIHYWFRDTGGRANGGRDTSVTNQFRLVVRPVNDPPLAVVTNRTELVLSEDAPAAATRFPGWLRNVVAGPPDEVAAGQRVQAVFSVEPPELFREPPHLTEDGTLQFQLAPDRFGEAVIRYRFDDDGGTADGGNPTGVTNLVVLTVHEVNDPPAALMPPGLSVRADVGPVEVVLRGVSPGQFEDAVDRISLTASAVAVVPASLVAADGVTLTEYSAGEGTLRVRFQPTVAESTDAEFRLRLHDERGAFADYTLPLRFVVGVAPPEFAVPVPAAWAEVDPATGLPLVELDEDEAPRTLDLAGLFAPASAAGLRFSVVTNTAAETLEAVIAGPELRLTPRPDQHGDGTMLLVAENDDYTVEFPFVFRVNPLADAPRLVSPSEWELNEESAWSETLLAESIEDPANPVSWELISGPTGLRLTSAGAISWSPTEADGPGEFVVRIRLTDRQAETPAGAVELRLRVAEVNRPPRFSTPADFAFDEETVFEESLAATDPDLPANRLEHRLLTGPPGLAVSAAGTLRWQPSEAQGPGVFLAAFTVTDEAVPPFTRTNFVRLHVREVPRAPVVSDLELAFRPGLALRLPAAVMLSRASDPEGLPVSLVPNQLHTAAGSEAVISADGVALTPTPVAMTDSIPVEVSDGALRSTLQIRLRRADTLPGELLRELPNRFRPGQVLEITLNPTEPVPPGTVIRERLPPGWIPERIPVGASWRASSRTLEWAALAGPRTELIRYRVLAGSGADAVAFTGETVRPDLILAIGGVQVLPASPPGQGFVTRSLPKDFVAGEEVEVRVHAEPANTTDRWSVRETWPENWTLVSTGPGWIREPVNRTLTAAFAGPSVRELTYQLRAPAVPTVAAAFAGTARFDDVEFSVTGETVIRFNRPPAVGLPGVSGREDEAMPVTLPVSDADGDPIAWAVESFGGIVAAATLGAETALTIWPKPDQAGPGQVILSAADGRQTARVMLTVQVVPVNDPPMPTPGELLGGEDRWLPFQLRAADVEGDRLRFRVVQAPTHGRVELNSRGGGSYRPDPDFHGEDSFGWVVSDAQDDSAPVLQRVFVAPDYDAPRPRPDTLAGKVGGPVSLSAAELVANDISPDGTLLRVVRWDSPTRGDIIVEPVGPDRWSFVPPPGFTGTVILQGWVTDGRTAVPSTVRVIVAAEPGAPVAVADFLEREFALALDFPAAELLDNDAPSLGVGRLVAVEEFSRNGARVTRRTDSTIRLESETLLAEDAFRYQLEDESGARAWGEVVVRMNSSPARLAFDGLLRGTEAQVTLSGTPRAPYRLQSAPTPAGPFLPLMGAEADRFGAWTGSIRLQDSGQFFRAAPDFLPGERPVLRLAGAKGDGVWGGELRGLPGIRYRIYCWRDDRRTKVELANLLVPQAGTRTMELYWNEDELIIWAEADP